MRGRELGLTGQDLQLYQTGEVIQIGVMIEKSLEKWIEDAQLWQALPKEAIPIPLKAKVKMAKKLVAGYPYSAQQAKDICDAFTNAFDIMQIRNRVVHDEWLSHTDGKITRFGHFPESFPGAGDSVDVVPGVGQGEYTNEDWEELRLKLWHAWWRLSHLTWVRPDPDGTFFFSNVSQHFEWVRGEFDLSRDAMRLWSAPMDEGESSGSAGL